MTEYYTLEGMEKLKKELKYLKKDKIKEIGKQLKEAASFGDLSENAAYEDAKDEQTSLYKRIAELEDKIKNGKTVEKKQTDKVQINSVITIELDGQEEKFQIVGLDQVDPGKGKISYESPIGKALLGKGEGEEVEVAMQGDNLNCKVLKIE